MSYILHCFIYPDVCRSGGQSMNSKNLPQYLSSSHIVFIVYDVTNAESFANLEDWLRLATLHAPAAKIHIVGNKVFFHSSLCTELNFVSGLGGFN